LVVDGKPFVALAGELGNDASTSLDHLRPIWPTLVQMNLNTVLPCAYWELMEPEQGKFDFTLVDGIIQEARRHNLRIGFVWFASWKNGLSSYAPVWVKKDWKQFPRALKKNGQALEIFSPVEGFGDATRDADARAFAALMRHIKEVDGQQHTVVMMQVENEVGILTESRDRSPAANKAFSGPVPKELMDYLAKHKDTLIPEFREVWAANGSKTSGTWEEVFGKGRPAEDVIPTRTTTPPLDLAVHQTGWKKLYWPVDEIFMAWHYARYINKVAEAGKKEYSIPMFVNTWLQQPDFAWPGVYPSGGPEPQVHDIWRAGAPAIDMLTPDLYVPEFDEECEKYVRNGNPLFMPEARGFSQGAANVLYAVGRHNAIGFSVFGIENNPRQDPENALGRAYGTLSQLMPMIVEHAGKGSMTGVVLAKDGQVEKVRLGDYTMNIERGAPRTTDGEAGRPPFEPTNPDPPKFGRPRAVPRTGALFILTAPDEFYVTASDALTITFTPNTPGPSMVGVGTVDEGSFVDGRWVQGRRLDHRVTVNNDIGALRVPAVGRSEHSILHVKLYRYQ
jgi:beta-galactosidase GanA